MAQAAMNYASVNQTEYSLNCYKFIHPFYQAHVGWHQIRFLVYSNLGNKQHEFKDQNVVNDFFKNYLGLCAEVEDSKLQKKYFTDC